MERKSYAFQELNREETLIHFNVSAHSQRVSGHLCTQTNQMVVSVWQSPRPTWHPSRLFSTCWKYSDTKSAEPEPAMNFCWWGGRAKPRAHFMFLFMYDLKAPSSPCPSLELSLLSKHKNKTKSPSFLSGKKRKTENRGNFSWTAPVLLSTQFCQHLFPLSVVKMQMSSSFPSLLLSLDNCETCYPFLSKVKELFLVGSLQEQQGTKHLLFLDPTVPLSAGGSLSWKDEDSHL